MLCCCNDSEDSTAEDLELNDAPQKLKPVDLDFVKLSVLNDKITTATVITFNYDKPFGWKWIIGKRELDDWGSLCNPYVVHFINERLLDYAGLYIVQILGYFVFLLALLWNLLHSTLISRLVLFAFTLFFAAATLYKFFIRRQMSFSAYWSTAGLLLHGLTIATTSLFLLTSHFWNLWDIEKRSDSEVNEVNVVKLVGVSMVVCAWANCLYVLRLTAAGIYVVMLVRVLRTFMRIAVIVIPTLVAFAMVFRMVLSSTNVSPWNLEAAKNTSSDNALIPDNEHHPFKIVEVMQWLLKILLMMIGEIEASDVMATKYWPAIGLLLVFVPFVHMLFMSFVVSLTVGDINELRTMSDEQILQIKLDAVLESHAFIKSFRWKEYLPVTLSEKIASHKHVNNVLVCLDDLTFYSAKTFAACARKRKSNGKKYRVVPDNEIPRNRQSVGRMLKQLLVGLDLPAYLEMDTNDRHLNSIEENNATMAEMNKMLGQMVQLLNNMDRTAGAAARSPIETHGEKSGSSLRPTTPVIMPRRDDLPFSSLAPMAGIRRAWAERQRGMSVEQDVDEGHFLLHPQAGISGGVKPDYSGLRNV